LHCNHRAFRGTELGMVNQPSVARGMSIHSALWSLGIPSPNVKYPDIRDCVSVRGVNIPSMVFFPQLCVFGPLLP